MKKSFSWEFDAVTGTYQCPELSEDLWQRSFRPGDFLDFRPVKIREAVRLTDLGRNSPECRVLIQVARGLSDLMADVVPHLRAAMSRDYGRDKKIAWYDEELDGFISGNWSDIHDPELILRRKP